ncbi:MAG TPA: hypothetical protein VJW73_07155 [Gemmatimonadaceae bacterium]|nr:hypothetical protein [Gemmatimonadaceae bacterium]
MKKHALYALVGLVAIGATGSFVLMRPQPTRLSVTARAGDDTVVINQIHPTRLTALVMDQYGRRWRSDSAVRYRRIAGDSISLSSIGEVRCYDRRDALVRATFGNLFQEVVLRCRPVAWIEAPTWLDLVVGDGPRDLSFVAHGPDGRAVTELRGAITVPDASIVAAEGTTMRPMRAGQTVASIEIGDAEASIPIVVYQPVESFVDNPQKQALMAMRLSLARGDTLEEPLPKAAFWVTYFSKDPSVAPPTIELQGDGSCSMGNGIRERRIEDGEYAKYCLTGNGARMMIAHGAGGAARVIGVVAIRLMR